MAARKKLLKTIPSKAEYEHYLKEVNEELFVYILSNKLF
jgi:hypothetical protein